MLRTPGAEAGGWEGFSTGRAWLAAGVGVAALLLFALTRWAPSPPAPEPLPEPSIGERSVPELSPERATPGDVHCSVDGAPRDPQWAEIWEIEAAAEGEIPRVHTVTVSGGWVVFRPLSPENVGMLRVPSYRDAGLAWIDGACINAVELAPSPVVKLVLRVLLPEWLDEEQVFVTLHLRDGGGSRTSEVEDGRVELEAHPGRGRIHVGVRIGQAQGTVLEQDVDLREGDEEPLEVDLRGLPEQGWLGEDDVGLAPGEKVLWLDGARPAGLRYGVIGSADRPAVVVIRGAEGVERTVEVPRRR
jgi:hypothetical protein